MANQKTREEAREQLANIDPAELARLFTKKMGKLQKEIEKKDALIAELTSQKTKARKESDQIIADAKAKAAKIEGEAAGHREEAMRIEKEAKVEAEKKIENARTEANSILDATLSSVRKDIVALEDKRGLTKRDALAFMENVAAEYDTIIAETNKQLSSYKDVRARLADQILSVETEEFRRFNIDDYVSPVPEPESAIEAVIRGNEEEDDDGLNFDTLRALLADAGEDESAHVPAIMPAKQESFALPVDEEDADLVATPSAPIHSDDDFFEVVSQLDNLDTPEPEPAEMPFAEQLVPAGPVQPQPEPAYEDSSDDWEEMSIEEVPLDDLEDIGDFAADIPESMPPQSFTATFMALGGEQEKHSEEFEFEEVDMADGWEQAQQPYVQQYQQPYPMQEPAQNGFEDVGEIESFEDIGYQQPAMQSDELGFDDLMEGLGDESPLKIPARPRHNGADQRNTPQWL